MTKIDEKKSANEITQKDRTIFCINIDERCTEDILYELFLQVGPIESIVRKADRNGHLIALVTYKHYESVDYAVRLFDKIILFGQRLKVQVSQQPPQANKDNLNRANSTTELNKSTQQQQLQRTPSYPNRVSSLDSLMNVQQQQQQQQQPPPIIPHPFNMQQQQQMQMIQQLMQQACQQQPGLMGQFFTPPPLPQQSPQQQPHMSRYDDRNNNNNQNKRNSRPHKSDQSHHQHHHHQHQNHHHNQHSSYERKNSNNNNNNNNYSNRDRSRSPHQRQRR